jgi:hypothetical protein
MFMKIFFTTCFIFSVIFISAQEKPEPILLPDIAYPILGMEKSPSSKYLFLSLAEGRFMLYDISRGRLTENSVPLWKNFEINGFEIGGDAEFSKDEKYILVSEQNALYTRDNKKPKPFKICILDISSGKIVYKTDGVNSAHFIKDSRTILLAVDNGIATYDIITGSSGEKQKITDCEIACLNHAQNLLAVSFDPERNDFNQSDGAGYNKKEVKNASKNKRLIAFYEYPSLKKIGVINEEIDVVFNMQYTEDDSYLLFFSRTWQAEHQHSNLLNGMDKTLDLNQFQRIDMSTLKVDNLNFIYKTSEQMPNSDISLNHDLFVFGENRGIFSGKRDVLVVQFSEQQTFLGTYSFQGRTNSRNLFSPAFAIDDASTILVAEGMKLFYWDYKTHPKYTQNIEQLNENAILDKAVEQLDTDLSDMESSLSKSISKKQISGLFLLNITVQKNGEVVSVFAQSDEKTNIQMQNMLKDIILNYRFDVSVPKNERIKFTYTFTL